MADRSARRRVFAALLAGDGTALLELVEHQFALGIEPGTSFPPDADDLLGPGETRDYALDVLVSRGTAFTM